MTLYQQVKFWVNYICKSISWFFFLTKNGDPPNCDQVQQLRCSICFPRIILHALIEKKIKGKKGNIAYILFGTSSMKRLVEFEHIEFLTAYVKEVVAYNISRLQIVGYEGYKAI